MNRRNAISYIATILGGTISAPAMAGIMGQKLNQLVHVPVSPVREALLAEIAEIIIPTTNTPGAKAAGVEKFIVKVMADCYSKADQEKFYNGLDKFEADTKVKFSKDFVSLDTAQRNDAVRDAVANNRPFFDRMKELTVSGYFTSEIGCTQALEYVPIPGRYDGCVPLKPGQKAWAI
jgi:hypothetical protein